MVIDELSSFKNHQAQRFKWLRKVRPFVKRWIGLTGTPTSNGLMDLWAEIGILDGGERLGRFIGRFRECYFKAGSMNPSTGVAFSYTPRPGAEEQIYQRISDITISMKAMDLFRTRDGPRNATSGSTYSFFMGTSAAGKSVNERSAMQMTAVYAERFRCLLTIVNVLELRQCEITG